MDNSQQNKVVEEPVEEVAEEPVEEPVEEVDEEVAEEPIEEVAEEVTEKSAEEVTEKPAEEEQAVKPAVEQKLTGKCKYNYRNIHCDDCPFCEHYRNCLDCQKLVL